MAVSQRLDLRQSQSLVMTPQLQQAIKLLQMSNQELGEFVAKEIEQNPLLEAGEAGETSEQSPVERVATAHDDAPAAQSSSSEPQPLTGDSREADAPASEDVWAQDGYSGDSDVAHSSSHSGSFNDDEFSAMQNVAERPSLRDHLLQQVQVDFATPADRLIASALVEMLDEAGYLPSDLELVRTQIGATPEHFEEVIGKLQRFDPAGIFARSLEECLALQLREQNRLDPAMQILIKHLDLVAKRERAALSKLCGLDAEDILAMIDEIKKLNPRPALAFTADVEIPIEPDVLLRPQPGGGWQLELNNDNLPRVLLNEKYYTTVNAAARSKSDKDYVSDQWQKANWLAKALHQRATTILKVAAEIVKQQDKFFIHGVKHLKPLILRDIATAVEMHESTVSRVTQHKYIATPRGMF